MILKGGLNWKVVRSRLAPVRPLLQVFLRTRFLIFLVLAGGIILLWNTIRSSAGEMQRFYCWGPAKPPMEMSANEQSLWHAHVQTPVIFNHHAPLKFDSKTIQKIDLNVIKSTKEALTREERVLILTPLRDAGPHIQQYFDLLAALTYPHHLIDLGFLVGDSKDDTLAILSNELARVQKQVGDKAFRSATIIQKDFGTSYSQDVTDRHSYKAQAPRRKLMAKARNYLLSATLKPEHSWVYWRDVDIVDSPKKIIEDLIAHDRDIIVPNVWFHRYENDKDIEGRFDYNLWQESPQALKLAASLPKDTVIVEGYKEFKTHRRYMCLEGDWRLDKDVEWELDGIGGVSILVKADVHRSGINFPAYAFENQAETEGFAKMAKRAGYSVIGLPNYVVWHIDTAEKGGNN